MGTLKLFLFVVVILLQMMFVGLNGQCCKFEVIPYTVNFDLLGEETGSAEGCDDLSYCYARAMVRGRLQKHPDSTDFYFEKMIGEITKGRVEERHLSLVLKYGRILEDAGLYNKAVFYYKYVLLHATESSLLKALAKIGLLEEGRMDHRFSDFLEQLEKDIGKLRPNEKIMVISFAMTRFDLKSNYKISDKYYYLVKEATNSVVGRLFLATLRYTLLSSGDQRGAYVSKRLESFNQEASIKLNFNSTHSIEVSVAQDEGDYASMYSLAKEGLVQNVGEFSSIDELIAILNSSGHYSSAVVDNFARASLYQTRLGKGLEPVIDAFKLYEYDNIVGLENRQNDLSDLTSNHNNGKKRIPENLIVVGNYLYQKTGDVQYLNRALVVTDALVSTGLSYWIKVRKKMRGDPEFTRRLKSINSTEEQLLGQVSELGLQELFDNVQQLFEEKEAFKVKYATLFEFEQGAVDLEEVQSTLQQDSSAYLGFISNDKVVYRLYLAGDTINIGPVGAPVKELFGLANRLPRLMVDEHSSSLADSISYRLYSTMFGDLEEIFPKRLHILEAGPLVGVSIAGMRTSPLDAMPEYLGTKHSLSFQSSLSSMMNLRDLELSPPQARPLGLAPSFGDEFLAASELRQAGFSLPPLLFSKEELENLEEQSAGRYLYDEDATLENYWNYAPDHGIIHLASHAVSSDQEGVRSRVFLKGGKGNVEPLYAGNVGDETLNAELVVLSACETGGGERHAVEGRVGLTKAYLAAGARSVVSSSWAVDDRATAELMGHFYASIANGAPPNDALQQARIAYRNDHPDAPVAKWAAFETYGGMRPVRWDREKEGLPWGWIGGGLATVALLGGVVWKRAA